MPLIHPTQYLPAARIRANAHRLYEAAGIAARTGIGNPETLRDAAAVFAVATRVMAAPATQSA